MLFTKNNNWCTSGIFFDLSAEFKNIILDKKSRVFTRLLFISKFLLSVNFYKKESDDALLKRN